MERKKIIGTFVPLTALFSSQQSHKDDGTFATGLVFLDWLKKTNQSAWQLLPLHETQLEDGSTTKHVPSPYKSYGIGISPQYLSTEFAKREPTPEEKLQFISENSEWITDYALFCSLRDHFKTDDWRKWDMDIRSRKKEAMAVWSNQLQPSIEQYILLQWRLHKSYQALRAKARQLDIILIGDLPFYPSVQSPLVWMWQDTFQLEKDRNLRFVSGVPNTETTQFGRQVWGHPLFNWENRDGVIEFWKVRLRYFAKQFDMIRFDHAKAFFYYGAMDLQDERNDTYMPGPGKSMLKILFNFAHEQGLKVFVEDSGDKVEDLREELAELNIAGIKVLRFAIKKPDLTTTTKYADIQHYPYNTVAYTTTHDTETLVGYLQMLTDTQKQLLASTAGVTYVQNDKQLARHLRDEMLHSPAKMVIIPIQDWLLITDRINFPGTEVAVDDPNWRFRLPTPIEELEIV